MHETAMSSGPIPTAELTGYQRQNGALIEAPPATQPKIDGEVSPALHRRTVDWVAIAVLAAFVIFLYRHVAVKLVVDWYELPDFSHGFLIPFFAGFLIWDKRRKLGSLRNEEETRYSLKDRHFAALAQKTKVTEKRSLIASAYFWLT